MISVLKMSIDEKSIKAVFTSISVKKEKKFVRFSAEFIDFYVDFYTNQKFFFASPVFGTANVVI